MGARLKKMIFLGIKQFSDPYYQGFAAQIAFYFLLAVVPIVIVLSQLLGVFDISLGTIDGMIDKYVSEDVAGMLKQMLSFNTNKSAAGSNTIMIITALWAASRAHFVLMRIANYTFTSGKSTGKGFWRERFRSVFSTALFLISIVAIIVVVIYGKAILTAILGNVIEGTFIESIWTYFRWPVTLLLYFLIVSYLYLILPSDRITFRDNLPGSIFGAVGMMVVTLIYSAYTNYITDYNVLYGSLASIVALLFWFFFLAWALCLGILFNKVWQDTKEGV